MNIKTFSSVSTLLAAGLLGFTNDLPARGNSNGSCCSNPEGSTLISTTYIKPEEKHIRERKGEEILDPQPIHYAFIGGGEGACLTWTTDEGIINAEGESVPPEIENGGRLVFDPFVQGGRPAAATIAAIASCPVDESFSHCVANDGLQTNVLRKAENEPGRKVFEALGEDSRQPPGMSLEVSTEDLLTEHLAAHRNRLSDLFVIDFNDTKAVRIDEPTEGMPRAIALRSEATYQLSAPLSGGDVASIINQDVIVKVSSDPHAVPTKVYGGRDAKLLYANTAEVIIEAFKDGVKVGRSDILNVVCYDEFQLTKVLKPVENDCGCLKGESNGSLEGEEGLTLRFIRINPGPSTYHSGKPGAIGVTVTESTPAGVIFRNAEPAGSVAPARVVELRGDDY